MAEKLYTAKALAEMTGVSVKTIYRLVESRELAAHRTSAAAGRGKRIYITEADWQAFMERRRTPAKQDTRPFGVPRFSPLPGADRYVS